MDAPPTEDQQPAKEKPTAEAPAFVPKDPAVEAILATQPREPAECVRAAKILADLGRPELAKEQLKKALEAQLDAEGLVALADRLGTAVFATLASRPELAPEARELADAVLGAVRRDREAPERIAAMISDLASPDAPTRVRASLELREAGPVAVAPLVAVLADANREDEHAAVRAVLIAMGKDAWHPLAGYLDSPDPGLVVQVIRVLASSGAGDVSLFLLAPFASSERPDEVRRAAGDALAHLVGPLPEPDEAAAILLDRAQEYFDQRRRVRADADGLATVWQWDASTGRSTARRYPPDVAAVVLAARLAGDALAITPGSEPVRQLYLLANLERLAYAAGLDAPLPVGPEAPSAKLAEFGPAALEAALDRALATGHAPAAAAAAQLLGQIGTAETILAGRAQPGPLARAMRSPDRRVRFAAVGAIMHLQPVRPFAGSSYLPETLAYLATATGARRVMVAGPGTEGSLAIGRLLAEQGLEVETAATGREMLEKLFDSADYELVFVDARIDGPPVSLLLQQLRHDARTALLPVGVLAAADQVDRARRAVAEDPLAEDFPRPHDPEAARWQVQRLAVLAGRRAVGPAERLQQAAAALEWLAELGDEPGGIYNLRRAESSAVGAVYSPGLGRQAVAVLAKLGTPRSQKALVDLASRATQPLAMRQAALEAFQASTDRCGILLTTNEILLQYHRYNQSAQADRATQAVLGAILDTIEAPSRAKREVGREMTNDQTPMTKE